MDLLSGNAGNDALIRSSELGGNLGSVSGQQQQSHQLAAFSLAAAAAAAGRSEQTFDAQQQQQQQSQFHYHGPSQAGAFFVAAAAASSHSSQVEMSGPMLYSEPNRTSAIDDIRSGVLYIFIVTIFLSFFLILPGIRNDKFPTFLCVTTSLLVTSLILISLFGTTWHVGEAPQMSAAYKAFSRDRIQGELSVKIGLQSVNITLRAHKYYLMHQIEGPMVLMDASMMATQDGQTSNRLADQMVSSASTNRNNDREQSNRHRPISATREFIKLQQSTSASDEANKENSNETLAEQLLNNRTSDDNFVDLVLESEDASNASSSRVARSSSRETTIASNWNSSARITKRSNNRYTIRKVNVDIKYNERFYWIEPQQMRHEHQRALERGLPYPILTVVEYLSQDEAGFNWSRKYRLAGYYASILLWLATGLCLLMFCLHCAAPKYGIYTMQLLGCILLFTNLIYSLLVPRGDKQLVIPFEGHSLTFKFGWSFWLVFIGGCVSLVVGTLIVIIDSLFPNYVFTTVLDVDYDSHQDNYMRQRYLNSKKLAQLDEGQRSRGTDDGQRNYNQKPELPPFLAKKKSKISRQHDSFPGQ